MSGKATPRTRSERERFQSLAEEATPLRINRGDDDDEESTSSVETEERFEPGGVEEFKEEELLLEQEQQQEEKGEDTPQETLQPKQDKVPTMTLIYGRQIEQKRKGETHLVIQQGNGGHDPTSLLKPSEFAFDPRQLRASPETSWIEVHELKPLEESSRFELNGKKISTKNWFERTQRYATYHGMDHCYWVHTGGKHYHLWHDQGKITKKMVEEAIKRIKDQDPIAYADQLRFGQYLLDSLGEEARENVIAGDTSDLRATEILFRLIQITRVDTISLIRIKEKELSQLSIKNDPTLDYSKHTQKVKKILHAIHDADTDAFVNHQFSRLVADSFFVDDQFHKEHVPLCVDDEVKGFYKAFKE